MRKILEILQKISQPVNSTKEDGFQFMDPGKLVDGELELVLVRRFPPSPNHRDAPIYRFKMTLVGEHVEVGNIDLRVGNTERILMYLGHIGYRVHPQFRGNHYAARATKLLLPLARSHGIKELWITCNPDNYASRRTCELVGGELVEIVDLPKNSSLYRAGELQKCRYRVDL